VIPLEFTVDSGASVVVIPADVVLTLVRTGTLQESDFTGKESFKLADGSTVSADNFVIRSLKVGNYVLENVKASTSPNASLLLGQSFLSRLPSWSIDNNRQVLLINAPPGTPQSAPQATAPQPQPQIASPSPPLANPTGRVATRSWLGVKMRSVTPAIAQDMVLQNAAGVIVDEAIANGPAFKAGVVGGDVIIAVNGTPVSDAQQLASLISNTAPGTTVALNLIHDDQQKTVSLALDAFPDGNVADTGAPPTVQPGPRYSPTASPPASPSVAAPPVAQTVPFVAAPFFVGRPFVTRPFIGRRLFRRPGFGGRRR